MLVMKEAILEDNPVKVDKKDGKTRLRVWPKNPDPNTRGDCKFTIKLTIKLTNEERLKLIHMLSE